jgi:hypothetical protein
MPRTQIIADVDIAVVSLVWPWIARLGLGRLPRDISSGERDFTLRVGHDRQSRARSSVADPVAFSR